MKKLLYLILCGTLLFCLTGCGDNKDSSTNNDGNETKETNETNETNEVTETTEDVVNDKMTLENFRKAMKDQGLSIIEGNCTEKSLNCGYVAVDETDDSRTTYTFQTYKDEDHATRFWNNQLSIMNENYETYNSVFKDEENKILELTTGERGIKIVYFYKTTSIYVTSDEFGNADSFSKVMKVLDELGYTLKTKINNTSSSDDEINN